MMLRIIVRCAMLRREASLRHMLRVRAMSRNAGDARELLRARFPPKNGEMLLQEA